MKKIGIIFIVVILCVLSFITGAFIAKNDYINQLFGEETEVVEETTTDEEVIIID